MNKTEFEIGELLELHLKVVRIDTNYRTKEKIYMVEVDNKYFDILSDGNHELQLVEKDTDDEDIEEGENND